MDIYFIKNESGKQSGPYTLEQVASLDDASLDTAIRSVEDSTWKTIGDLPTLAKRLDKGGTTQRIRVEKAEATQEIKVPPHQRREKSGLKLVDPPRKESAAAKPRRIEVGKAIPKTIPQLAYVFYAMAGLWAVAVLVDGVALFAIPHLNTALLALGGAGAFALAALVITLLTQLRNYVRLIAARQSGGN